MFRLILLKFDVKSSIQKGNPIEITLNLVMKNLKFYVNSVVLKDNFVSKTHLTPNSKT